MDHIYLHNYHSWPYCDQFIGAHYLIGANFAINFCFHLGCENIQNCNL